MPGAPSETRTRSAPPIRSRPLHPLPCSQTAGRALLRQLAHRKSTLLERGCGNGSRRRRPQPRGSVGLEPTRGRSRRWDGETDPARQVYPSSLANETRRIPPAQRPGRASAILVGRFHGSNGMPTKTGSPRCCCDTWVNTSYDRSGYDRFHGIDLPKLNGDDPTPSLHAKKWADLDGRRYARRWRG